MSKLDPKRHGGVEFVRLATLPPQQADVLQHWLPESCMTKIQNADQLLEDCIEYDDYEFWYEHIYRKEEEYLDEQL